MDLSEVSLVPVTAGEEGRFRAEMEVRHYLGAPWKIGETIWYVALWQREWVALAAFSAGALKCGARDRWIGWTLRHRYDRLHLIANNVRFLLLRQVPNLGSRVLSLCEHRLRIDWPQRYGHRLVLLETFVDPALFRGTVYRAANWYPVGRTLVPDARGALTSADLASPDRHGESGIRLSAAQMASLFDYFRDIGDPRRLQGRRHRLATVLALAAQLCGAIGCKGMNRRIGRLPQRMLHRFRCRWVAGPYQRPSPSAVRAVLVRTDAAEREAALARRCHDHGWEREPAE